ncbi:RagB/SusD family nutrient uptake outer membrane protein, partial [Salmonella enterica]|uniref:RagB/SusD family nutrient uptake outer membrane protein n=1 Tax=Salmonella enterica TaxID=28901 RepID=UPI003D27E7D7
FICGAAKNPTDAPAIPVFAAGTNDANDIPDYSASVSKRISSRNQTRNTGTKHLLWPIPQGDIDKDSKLTQNPGW